MTCFAGFSTRNALLVAALSYLTHNVISICPDTSPKVFLSQPGNIGVKEGSNATISCVVSNFDPDADRITWYIDPGTYENKIDLSFNDMNREMTSTLTIFNVGRQKHTMQCVLYVPNSQKGVQMCHSTIGTLFLQHFPETDDLQCGPKGSMTLNEGDLVEVWCSISFWNPEMIMTLYQDDTIFHSSDGTEDNKDKRVLRKTMKVVHSFQSSSVTCSVTNPSVFPGKHLSCNIGPFLVLHNMHLDETEKYLSVSERILEKQENDWKTEEMPMVTEIVTSTEQKNDNHLIQTVDPHYRDKVAEYRNSHPSVQPLSLANDSLSTTEIDDFSDTSESNIRNKLPDQLDQNLIGIIVGVPIAAVVLVACLFVVVVVGLHRQLRQPRSNMALDDIKELQKLASMLQEQRAEPYTFSPENSETIKEPDYAEPDYYADPQLFPKPFLQTPSPKPPTSDEDTASNSSYTCIDNSNSACSRNSLATSSSSSSDSVDSDTTDRSEYQEDISSHEDCSKNLSINCVYRNHNVVDIHFPTTRARNSNGASHVGMREMVDCVDFPVQPPIPTSSY